MCPLRYIVLFVSAFVALCVMAWPSFKAYLFPEEDELAEILLDEDKQKNEEEKEAKHETKPIDFLTGRYLIEKYKQYKASQSRHQSSGISEKPGPIMQGALTLISSSPQ